MIRSLFAQSTLRTPLKENSRLRPHGNRGKKSINIGLMLTSLVDAFVLLVIYMVTNSSDGPQFELKEGINMPQASYSSSLDTSPVVTFKDNQFFIDEQPVAQNNLQAALESLKNKSLSLFKNGIPAIIVQADEKIGFEKLQPLIVASSYAGIKQVKFAVLAED